jgi:HEAT repeat protein
VPETGVIRGAIGSTEKDRQGGGDGGECPDRAEPESRRVAAQNLGFALPSKTSELLLRLKVLAGDESPEVLGDCFSSLLYAAPERSFDFVVGFLASGDPDVVQAASIALAQSQLRGRAVPLLVDRFRGSFGTEYKEIMLASIALARIPPAVDFLLKVVADEQPDLAAAAIRAMSCYRADEGMRERMREIVSSRGLRMLSEEFARSFRP